MDLAACSCHEATDEGEAESAMDAVRSRWLRGETVDENVVGVSRDPRAGVAHLDGHVAIGSATEVHSDCAVLARLGGFRRGQRRALGAGDACPHRTLPQDRSERPERLRPVVADMADVRQLDLTPRAIHTDFGGLFLFLPDLVSANLAFLRAGQ